VVIPAGCVDVSVGYFILYFVGFRRIVLGNVLIWLMVVFVAYFCYGSVGVGSGRECLSPNDRFMTLAHKAFVHHICFSSSFTRCVV
jgi:hypothetical protein